MLVQYVLPNGAAAFVVTTLSGYFLSFSEYLSSLPFIVRGAFYMCALVVAFALVNHIRQRWPTPREQQEGHAEQQNELEAQEQLAPVNEDLRKRCCELSAELFEFYGRWRDNKDEVLQSGGLIARVQYEIDGDPDRLLEAARQDSWLMKEYSEQFASKVLKLSDELAQHRCITPETRKSMESPEKPQDVQYIAQRLAAICNRSEFDPQNLRGVPTNQPEADRARELETQERRFADDALETYRTQIEQWLHDKDKPLQGSTRDDAVVASAQERTFAVLKRLDPGGKRDVLRFVHRHRLIKHGETIISMREADLSEADLSSISLTDANLDYVILRGADLSCAKLCGSFRMGSAEHAASAQRQGDWFDLACPMRASSFFNAKLNGAVLEGAALARCYMIGADFAGANLDRADLRGADLRLTRNLTQKQIEQAYGSSGQQEYMPDTRLPEHLEAPEAWRKLLSQQKSERG